MTAVVVTGLGLLHPHGDSPAELARALLAVRPPATPEIAGFAPGSGVAESSRRVRKMDRLGQYACRAALSALRSAGLDEPPDRERAGVMLGTMFGGLEACAGVHRDLVQRGPLAVNPAEFANTAHNVAAGQVAIGLQLQGPVLTLGSGLAAGLEAVVAATRAILGGRCDLAVAGGVERWTAELGAALADAGLLAAGETGGGPGLTPAEGACFLVLEQEEHARRRGAAPLARILGYGQASGRRGDGLRRALGRALGMAGDPEVAAICAGVQGRPAYDAMVLAAYGEALGWLPAGAARLTPKAALGETFGAAGAFALAAVLAPAAGPAPGGGRRGAVLVDALCWGGAAAAVLIAPERPWERTAA